MLVFLWILEIIVGVLLILAVLLQSGRGGGLSEIMGGSAQSIFGPTGPTTLLEKITYGLIAAFFVLTLLIGIFSTPRIGVETQPQVPTPPPLELPQQPQPQPQIPQP